MRARDFLTCSRLFSGVKAIVVMATLTISLILIVMPFTTPRPDFDMLEKQSALTSRLQGQLSILEQRLENRTALLKDLKSSHAQQSSMFSRLEDQVSSLGEHLDNRSALTKRLGDQVSTLEERLVNSTALISRLEDRMSLLEKDSPVVVERNHENKKTFVIDLSKFG
ncbi:uncharacterized protein LOC144886259 [Branchiostoma floridae x Branchiostoma japonicum]